MVSVCAGGIKEGLIAGGCGGSTSPVIIISYTKLESVGLACIKEVKERENYKKISI